MGLSTMHNIFIFHIPTLSFETFTLKIHFPVFENFVTIYRGNSNKYREIIIQMD